MAECEFPKELGLVRGTLCKSVYHDKGEKVEQRVIAVVRNGKQRLYFRSYKPRTKKVSDKELAARERFKQNSIYIRDLSDELKEAYALEWRKAKHMYNGKKYCSLRGYIFARVNAQDCIGSKS